MVNTKSLYILWQKLHRHAPNIFRQGNKWLLQSNFFSHLSFYPIPCRILYACVNNSNSMSKLHSYPPANICPLVTPVIQGWICWWQGLRLGVRPGKRPLQTLEEGSRPLLGSSFWSRRRGRHWVLESFFTSPRFFDPRGRSQSEEGQGRTLQSTGPSIGDQVC